jgi:hypothetical protein
VGESLEQCKAIGFTMMVGNSDILNEANSTIDACAAISSRSPQIEDIGHLRCVGILGEHHRRLEMVNAG